MSEEQVPSPYTREWMNPNAKLAELVHEITHAVFHLCERKGIEYNSGSEEVYAYLMESIFLNLTN